MINSSTQVLPAAQRESASVDSVSAEIIGILDTIDLPIMVVGRDCSVARFNQAAADALGLTISDVGRRPCNIRVLSEFPEIETLCSQVMADTAPLRREVRLADRWFLLRMVPYTGSDGQLRGAVLTFTNVTGFRESIGRALYEREYLKAILNTVNDAFVVLDTELRVQTGNRTFYEMFAISREAAQGVPLSSLGNDAWKNLDVWSSLRATLLDNHDFRTVEVQRDVPSGGRRVLLLDARRFAPSGSVLVLLVLRDISERKQAEEAVRASEQGYRQLVSLMPAGVYACDREGRITFYNRRAAELWGREPKLNDAAETFCGAFRCWLNDQVLTPVETPMAVAVRQGKAFRDLDPVFERPDGSKLSVLVNIDPILDSQGNPAGAINVFQDVTPLKSIEGELRRKTGQLAAFLETAAVGLHRVGPDGIIQWANDAEMRMLGYSAEEYIGHHIAEFHADEPVIGDILKQLTCGEKLFEREARLRCKDGSIKHVLIDSGVLWEDGKFLHTQCFTRDVTERKNAETALRESEERFREVVNNSTANIWVKDLEGRYLLINRCFEKRFHVTEEQFVGKTDFDLFPAEVAQTFWENDLKIITTGKPLEVEEIAPHDDGPHAYISIRFPLRRVDGNIYAVAGMATDITERKRVEESAARLAAIIRHSDDAIFSMDLNGVIKSWNRGAERLYGYAATEAIGQSITMLVPEGRENDESQILDRIRQGQATENYETLRRRKDGRIIDVSLTVSPIRDLNGKLIGASTVARDISDKVQAREKLEQTVAERTAQLRDTVAELEAFSYSVAHDMRAPLRAMNSYSRLLQSEFADALPTDGKEFTRRIAAGASRLDSLITDVLNYSKIARSEMTLEKVDVEKLARDIVESYPNLQECGATILVQSPIPSVIGNSAALTQCFSNLLSNAAKFVAPGTKPRVLIRAEKNCDVVRLWFEDNGIGISEEGQKRIFRLFQRLNPAINFEGSGIGLTIVRKAVERMGGRVGVESQVGTGSRFWIELKGA